MDLGERNVITRINMIVWDNHEKYPNYTLKLMVRINPSSLELALLKFCWFAICEEYVRWDVTWTFVKIGSLCIELLCNDILNLFQGRFTPFGRTCNHLHIFWIVALARPIISDFKLLNKKYKQNNKIFAWQYWSSIQLVCITMFSSYCDSRL